MSERKDKAFIQLLQKAKLRRIETLAELKFPYPSVRPAQKEMMRSVLSSVAEYQPLLLQAPTGTGKTMGTLFPALKALSKQWISHIFYATAKRTTRIVASEALYLLRKQEGVQLKSLLLVAQDVLCPQHGETCQQRGYLDLADENDQLAILACLEKDHIGKKILQDTALRFGICPFQLMLSLLPFVDVILGDYNHILDPQIRLKKFLDAKSSKVLFLIDEAHNLVDRAKNMFTIQMSFSQIHQIKQLLAAGKHSVTYPEELVLQIDKLYRYFLSLVKSISSEECSSFTKYDMDEANPSIYKEGHFIAKLSPSTYLAQLFSETKKLFDSILETLLPEELHYKIKDMVYKLKFFLLYMQMYWKKPEDWVLCAEHINQDILLSLYPHNLSDALYEQWKDKHLPILFSATLSPLTYYKKALGSTKRPFTIVEGSSPFSSDQNCVLISNFNASYQNRLDSLHELQEHILTCLQAKKGNYLIYLSSYSYIKNFYHLIQGHPYLQEHYEMFVQDKHWGTKEKQAFLHAFSQPFDPASTSKAKLGLVVLGGGFAEGIDLVGERLMGVMIVGLGIAPSSPRQNLLLRYYSMKGENGFDFAYRYPGFNRILQAAGRVIRSEEDRGIILLCDKRLQEDYMYAQLFPSLWRAKNVYSSKDIERELKNFW